MKTRKILAVILSVAMLLSLLTQAVWATEAEPQTQTASEVSNETVESDGLPELPENPPEEESNPPAENNNPEPAPESSDTLEDSPQQTDSELQQSEDESQQTEDEPQQTEGEPQQAENELESDNSESNGPAEMLPETLLGDPNLQINPMSLLPLETYSTSVLLDRTVNFPDELEQVSPYAFYVREVLTDILVQNGELSAPDAEYSGIIMYASEQDNFVQVGMNDIVMPSENYIYTNYQTKNNYTVAHFIIDDGDQFNPNNRRYEVTIEYILTETDFFNNVSLVITNSEGEEIRTANPNGYYSSNYAGMYYNSYCYISKSSLEKGEYPRLLVKLGEKYSAANVEVYHGFIHSDADIGDKENIASKILYDSASREPVEMQRYNYAEDYEGMINNFLDLTYVVTAADGTRKFLIAQYDVYLCDNRISLNADGNYTSMEYLYKTPDDFSYSNTLSGSTSYIERYPAGMFSDFSELSIRLYAYYYDYIDTADSGYGSSDISKIAYACFGEYESKEEAISAGEEDIKERLFGSRSAASEVDFSRFDEIKAYLDDGSEVKVKVINVTVEDIYGFVYNATYYVALADSIPENISDSTYFTVTGAEKPDVGSGNTWLSTYKVRAQDDSYYRNGYQTVFLLDGGQPYEGEVLVPTFGTGNGVVMHMDSSFMAEPSSDDTQISGKSKVLFKDGQSIQYAAKSASGEELKNYWVTFVTQHRGGSKLFVNAANNEAAKVDGKAVREIFYNDYFGYDHDILIANVGDQPLTGIKAELKDAKGVMLDPYWSVLNTSVKTLAAFDSTSSPWSNELGQELNGELYNLAKIRLLPSLVYEDVYGGLYNENGEALYEKVRNVSYFGEISGTLTISADGSEPVEITLTGIAGTPKITTDSLLGGVKYVPYSCLIMTNSMYDTGSMKFSIVDGALPKGIELMPDGELYGIPMESNEEGYTFTVEARFVGAAPAGTDISGFVDYKTYTLRVADNTDANVDAVNLEENQGYVLTDRVSKYVTVYYRSLNEDGTPFVEKIEIDSNLFHSEGQLGDFKEFYIDGIKLTKGTDYNAEEGSTKITVLAETFSHIGISDGSVPHTLAAEFRAGEDELLKKSAQNVYLSYLEYKEQQSQANPGTGVPSNPSQWYWQNPLPANAFDTVSTHITIVDTNNNVLPNLNLELHSNVKYATTDDSGNVRFDDVEFGRHTLYVTDTSNNTVAKEFTLVSGFGADLTGDIITAEVGQTVHITFTYDGIYLSILKVETEVDIPQEGTTNEDETEGVDDTALSNNKSDEDAAPAEDEPKAVNPGTGLVLGLAPVTVLAWILVFIKRR